MLKGFVGNAAAEFDVDGIGEAAWQRLAKEDVLRAGRPDQARATRDPQILIDTATECLSAGASIIMIESEGITENADPWRTDVAARIIKQVGMENVMFEAADPPVFEWYIKNFGVDINLFVDYSQIVQLECLRRDIWGTKSTFGRITSHR